MFHHGEGEIDVRGESDIVYCTPPMTLHHVAEHPYQPPHEFIEAVIFQRELRLNRDGRGGAITAPTDS